MIISTSSYPSPVAPPTPGAITILAKSPVTPYNRDYPTDKYEAQFTSARFKEIFQCDFNAISIAAEKERDLDIAKTFERAEDSGLKIIICQQDKDEMQMSNLVNKYKDNPLLGGYEMMDEPLFEKLSWLKAIHDKIRELDPKHLVYTNLAVDMTPSSSEWKDHLGDIGTLEEYLDYFQNMFHPVLWSYDFYPVRYYNRRTIVRTSDFYKFLQMFHDKAKKANRPFWTYSLCMPYVEKCYPASACVLGPDKNGRPIPTEGELRWEAFSALAYGAQGIVYWSYSQRYSIKNSNGVYGEYYTSAPIDLQGNKTEIWYRVQTVNSEIKMFNHVFYGCEVIDVRHAGTTYPGTKPFSSTFGFIKTLETEAQGVMVSHLKNGDNDFIVIVNHDPFNFQKIKLEFSDPNSIIGISPVSPKPNPDEDDSETTGYTYLQPGGYLIFKVM